MMPTKHQIKEINETVVSLHPNARIACVRSDGVFFEYPDAGVAEASAWDGKPFTGAK